MTADRWRSVRSTARSPTSEGPLGGAAADEALATRPGYLRSQFARALDDPTAVGAGERMGGGWRLAAVAVDYDVRIEIIPLMAMAQDEPGVYETPDA